ncbi:hypothetical protein E2C01_008889 [Portunus trituberculatus]|uniref:Uncharacterized protein n=1 Tax=Portunus trituberculatus TaxID=210409 RepID=A0A5B7D432_PORTR|nr:hypothetical protein [Portunus trituberculatus]
MRALGSEGSPSARVRILSTVDLPHSGQRFPSGSRQRQEDTKTHDMPRGSMSVSRVIRPSLASLTVRTREYNRLRFTPSRPRGIPIRHDPQLKSRSVGV